TFDHGRLEFLSPQLSHEQYGVLLGRMVVFYCYARKIPFHTGRMVTLKRESLQRGLEPDDCYWIQNEPRMKCRKDFDPEQDPPPDLAIEVDVISSSLPRMSIYAALGVQEVWRYDGEAFTINLLRDSGQYETSDSGLALPALTVEVVTRFLGLSDHLGEAEWLASFTDWCNEGERTAKPQAKKTRRPRKK